MAAWICKGVMLFSSVALCFSVENWLRARQELRVVTAANESLRKTLGNLIVAMGEKDREIDRLAGSPCEGNERRSALAGPLIPSRKSDGL
jgi:hypothetical protein